MAFTRTTTINSAPGGDSVKQAVLDLDTDLTWAFANANTTQNDLNVHKGLTTNPHSVTYAQTGAAPLAGSSSQDFAAKNLTTSGNTTLGDATTDTLTVGVNGIVKTATSNVLIGTTIDDGVNKLQVSGSGSVTSLYFSGRLLPSATNTGGTAISPSVCVGYDYDTGLFLAGVNTIGVSTLGTERMRVTQTGNVLVGTTTDIGTNLNVSAAGSAVYSKSAVTLYNSGSVNYYPQFSLRKSKSATDGVLAATGLNDYLGQFSFHGVNSSAAWTETALISCLQTADAGATYNAGRLLFSTSNGTTVALIRAVISEYGNLLIGTTTDDGTNKLQVNGGISFVKTVTNPGAFSPTHKVPITINGITYYMALTTS